MSTTTFTPSAAVAQARPSSRGIWLGFLVVLAASVMDLLDSTIAQTAAPAIRRDLGGSYATRTDHVRNNREKGRIEDRNRP